MKIWTMVTIFGLILFFSTEALTQTTAFNFQGRLNDGTSPANGRYDLQFKLFTAIAGGSQVGTTVDRPNLLLINGVFSTTLDFGGSAFTGGDRFIEMSVRPNGSPNAHVVLGGRQQILSVPYSVHSASANNADNATNAQQAATATIATSAINAANATTAQNSLSLGGVASSSYARLGFANQGDLVGANVGSNGYLSVQGNAFQPLASNGLPKAMVAITGDGTIVRCYNGVTGVTSGNCGISAIGISGVYHITFPFQISDRFWLVTNHRTIGMAESDVVTTSVVPTPFGPTSILKVLTYFNGTNQALPFHVFVF